MTAPELVELLNEYLGNDNILLDNGGTLDKYIGDAIIAIFGSPVELKNHEYKGALAICQMNDKLEELRKKWRILREINGQRLCTICDIVLV